MTTKVIVEANHGWPVRVTPLNPKTGEADEQGRVETVPAGAQMTFYVHSTRDLLIHEVQPDEQAAAEVEGNDDAATGDDKVAQGDVG